MKKHSNSVEERTGKSLRKSNILRRRQKRNFKWQRISLDGYR